MRTQWPIGRAAAAAFILGALALGAARAQSAPDAGADAAKTPAEANPKARPKSAKPKLPLVAVAVTNARKVKLLELDATLADGADPVKIAGPLEAGKKIIAHVAHDKPCLFDLHGAYEDGTTTDAPSVNLCAEKKINLVE